LRAPRLRFTLCNWPYLPFLVNVFLYPFGSFRPAFRLRFMTLML